MVFFTIFFRSDAPGSGSEAAIYVQEVSWGVFREEQQREVQKVGCVGEADVGHSYNKASVDSTRTSGVTGPLQEVSLIELGSLAFVPQHPPVSGYRFPRLPGKGVYPQT